MAAAVSPVRLIAGVTLCVLLLALTAGSVACTLLLAHKLRESVVANADMHDDTTLDDAIALKAALEKQPFTASARIITKEEALKALSEAEGADISGFLGFNPLFNSVEIHLTPDYISSDSLAQIKTMVLANPKVRALSWNNSTVDGIHSLVARIYTTGGVLTTLLFAALVFAARFALRAYRKYCRQKWQLVS